VRDPRAARLIRAVRALLRGALALAAIGLGRPAPAHAVPAPEAERLAALQAACDSAWRVRMVSLRATYLLERPGLGPQGVNVAPHTSGPPALITIGEAPPDAKWIPWAEVERMESAQSRAGWGAVKGLLVGGVAGGLLVSAHGPDLAEDNDNVVAVFAVVLTVGCTVAGYLLGLASPSLTPLYP
jgi:hypothetical protein